MFDSYMKLALAALLPTIASLAMFLLDKSTPFGKIKYKYKQLVFGVIFGLIAIMGTEFGIPISGAQMNCRDAAVLSAGLFFGAPAGLIAGAIGGIERWFAVAWGIGEYTQLACSVSTFIAGVYSGLLRKFMFENKRPGTFISLAIGVVMEVLHMTMVFLTNMDTPTKAMEVVKICSAYMIPANGISVMAAALILALVSKDIVKIKTEKTRISRTIQKWLLVTIVLAFIATSAFIYQLQDRIASSQADSLLDLAVKETAADISDASDENLLSIAYDVKKLLYSKTLEEIAEEFNLAEISLINKHGIIYKSSVKEFAGFDMASGSQSKEFMCLLGDTEQFVQEYGPISYNQSISRKYAGIKTDEGFLQVGYDAEYIQNDIDKQVVGITKNRHVGETGYVLILDGHFNIISAPKDMQQKNLVQESSRIEIPDPDTTFSMTFDGVKYLCRYEMAEGYYIFSVLPEDEAWQIRNIALYVNTFMEILVFAILFALVYLLIKKAVVNQIKNVNNSLTKITDGDLDEVVNVRTSAEFNSLSDDINSTVKTLKRYISEASARIDRELEFAKEIQTSSIPNTFPAFPKRNDFDIYASMDPAKEVGGDFYDFYMTHEDLLHFVIADVSGKGIPAAMFMMRAKTELKSLTEADLPIDAIFTNGNNALCEGNDAGMFVTAWQGGIDLTTGLVKFANAGHNPPIVRHADGKFELMKIKPGFILAGMEDTVYREQQLQLEPGDIIFLYTDGVTEATNIHNELYGETRLLHALNTKEFADMKELCEFVKNDVDSFVGEAPQFDDITMVALKFIGTPPAPSISFEKAALEDITAVTEFIEEELEKHDCPMKTIIQMNVAVDEIYSNIVRYGYPKEPGPITVKVIVKEDIRQAYIRFCDEGIPYNPLTKEDPDVTLSADERTIGGLGIFIVKNTMSDVKYKYEGGMNILTLMKKY